MLAVATEVIGHLLTDLHRMTATSDRGETEE
jgi:hypothetical protein